MVSWQAEPAAAVRERLIALIRGHTPDGSAWDAVTIVAPPDPHDAAEANAPHGVNPGLIDEGDGR